ncbi:MAG: 3-dehydroquinate synthase [Anaerolineae bacterium]|nr:3-dehydroquinate synthase [Anaerolineae bacterium]MDW8173124.1 3-dehydroquinate synthase [Anaerolineae bacterium]
MEERIVVHSPTGAYEILIGAGLLRQIGQRADEWGLHGQVVVTTDDIVRDLWAKPILAQLPQGRAALIPHGEQHKTLKTVSALYDQWIALGADRQTTILALGGGVVGDTAGFAAATYMRGLRLVQAPTTLLAMVDSSVGGKVGVDLPQGKNLVGAFKQPALVLIDTDALATLPPVQWRMGMAEVIKHGLLADPELLHPSLRAPERAVELVRRAVQVKVNIVEQDPYEQNIRAYLNLGHTFAHAIEQVSGYAWLHGEAVAVGLLAAAKLSARLGLCDEALADEISVILAELGLPLSLGGLEAEALYAAMATDKKWVSGRSRFVLLDGPQRPRLVEGVPRSDVLAVLEALR